MRHWNEAKIKEFAEVKGGKRLPKGKQLIKEQNSHPYIRIRDLGKSKYLQLTSEYEYVDDETQQSIARYIVNEGDILISVVGTIGLIGIVGATLDKANQTENCDKIINIKGLIPEYLYYYLVSDFGQEEIRKGTVGAVQPKLPLKNVQDISVRYPSMEEQEKIVAILSSIDEKIAINEKINNNLEQRVSALYQSWFEDFDPTNGVCPDNWSNQMLSTIADISSGKRPPIKSEVYSQETPISIVGAASVMGFTSEANHTDKILVTGRVGTHGVIQRFNTPCWTSDNTLVITSPFYEFTNQILHRIDYSSMNRGSTQPLITQGDTKKVVVLVPDEETLAKFEALAGSLMAQWEANNNENVKLASLRDTLLPKLMSGELDVSDLDL